ncbi:nucleoside-diphosphate sugar epimerase/dehydratase [Brevundimonas sp.]|uniref:polysaccharide biosynthesis protein n=1 Tax=Brevundimonas sp. TaxID=1871086 RepID=UPI002D52531C|nr:nucleoside-diphosphate sugar epimerase/dehydratase [Brevundimonas sp.]HYD28110.1 nucleoside-diphosphate sugar epimerase/dehydratase [Brevundimonas sp.]
MLTRTAKFGAHIVTVFCAFLIAYELRRALPLSWWVEHPDASRVFGWAALYAGAAGLVEIISRTEHGAWRFTSAREAIALLRNMTLTVLLFTVLIFFLDRGIRLPRSVLPLAWLLSFLMLVGLRLGWRLFYDRSLAASAFPAWWRRSPSDKIPLLVVGTLAESDRHIRHLLTDAASPYRPVAILSPVKQESGLRLHDIPCVGSPARLERTIPSRRSSDGSTPAAVLFLADPVTDFQLSMNLIGRLRQAGHPLLRPMSIKFLEDEEKSTGSRLQEIRLEEFLPRAPVSLNPEPLRALVAGRRILVTGAGGSIGSELCRQLATLGCAHLTLVDHSEFLLFGIDREIERIGPQVTHRALLADVRDLSRLTDVFQRERPDLVFHAAALKHVAMVEDNPAEGVLTNVFGTWNVLQAAVGCGVKQMVLISTDKAVAPTSIMGATKRIAETLLELQSYYPTRVCAVRFGNVLGSAGSVIPIFQRQIAEGGPLTVTDPEVNRYFMTIPEAVQLVLHSTALCTGGDERKARKFLLEMGETVKIVDLARQMIALSGRAEGEIEIQFTGLKPGEKLTEVLFEENEEITPCSEGIMEIQAPTSETKLTISALERLRDASLAGDDEVVKAMVRSIIADFRAETAAA